MHHKDIEKRSWELVEISFIADTLGCSSPWAGKPSIYAVIVGEQEDYLVVQNEEDCLTWTFIDAFVVEEIKLVDEEEFGFTLRDINEYLIALRGGGDKLFNLYPKIEYYPIPKYLSKPLINNRYPHICDVCGSPAWLGGMNNVDCSNKSCIFG